jgi:hypothetical protein
MILGRRGIRYTKADDAIIINQIKKNPTNLDTAFKKAALLLEIRTEKGVAQRYYNKLRNDVPMIALGNDQTMMVNTKNTLSTADASMFNAQTRDKVITDLFMAAPKEALIHFILNNVSLEDKKKMLRKMIRTLSS